MRCFRQSKMARMGVACFFVLSSIAGVVLFDAPALADVIRQPEGLNPGDQYRLLFTTSTTRDATSANIDEYNAFVQTAAVAAPILGSWGLNWNVVGSTAEIDARDNTNTNRLTDGRGVPIYRVDGVLIAGDYWDLWGDADDPVPRIEARWNVTELGVEIPVVGESGPFVATGTTLGGIAALSPLGSTNPSAVRIGLANDPSFLAFSFPVGSNLPDYRYYAMSEVLTAGPEPESMSGMVVGLLFIAGGKSRRVRL